MVKIDKIKWGNLWLAGKKYHQVLIIADQVFERESEKLRQLFGTTHQIGDWEEKLLLAQNPEIILIGLGWNGDVEIRPEFREKIKKKKIELKAILTGQAAAVYNDLVQAGKRVNALIHTTC
jgi:hypothetical protein